MTVTRTGAWASPCARYKPPKPPPTITTRGSCLLPARAFTCSSTPTLFGCWGEELVPQSGCLLVAFSARLWWKPNRQKQISPVGKIQLIQVYGVGLLPLIAIHLVIDRDALPRGGTRAFVVV